MLFRLAVAAAATGMFSPAAAAGSFIVLAVGGVAVGAVAGAASTWIITRLRDANLAVVVSLLTAWVSYIGGEALGVSGVLSTVACGLVIGSRQHATLSAAMRTRLSAVWGAVTYVLEALVFVLIGLALRGVLGRLDAVPGGTAGLVLPGCAVLVAVVLSRFAWIVPTTYLTRLLVPGLRRRDPYPPLAVPVVLSWAGMRGVVSLAVALGLPEDFPGRDAILVITFAVILMTVLVQGATLAPLIRWLDLGSFTLAQPDTLPETAARARMAAAQLAVIQSRAVLADGTVRHPRLLEQYSYRAQASARFHEAAGSLDGHREEHFSTVLAAIAAGRAEILRLHREGSIHDSVLQALEDELDLEEMSARRHLAGG